MSTKSELATTPITLKQRRYLYGLTKDYQYMEKELSMEDAGKLIALFRRQKK